MIPLAPDLMSELVWTDGKVSVIGIHPSGRLSLSIIKPSKQRGKHWMWHLTYDVQGEWGSQNVKLSALGWGRTKKEAIQRSSDWYDRLRKARQGYYD